MVSQLSLRAGMTEPIASRAGAASSSTSRTPGTRPVDPVLFIHGFSQCRLAWRSQCAPTSR